VTFAHYQYAPMSDVPPGWWFVESDGKRWKSLGARPVYVREDDPHRDPNVAHEIDWWDQASKPADGSCGERTIRLDGARKRMVWVEVPAPPSA
jgi:hypothetical protein